MATIQILTQIPKISYNMHYLDISILARVRKYTSSSDDTERSQEPKSDCDESSPDPTREEQVTSSIKFLIRSENNSL